MMDEDRRAALIDSCDPDPQVAAAALAWFDRTQPSASAQTAELLDQYRLHAALRALHPPPTDCAARVCRLLARRRSQQRWRRGLAIGLVAALLLAAAAWWWRPAPPRSTDPAASPEPAIAWSPVPAVGIAGLPADRRRPQPGDRLRITGQTPLALIDPYGARFICDPGSRLLLTDSGLDLEQGGLQAQVPPRPATAALQITTERARFRVVGTRFSLQHDETQTRLAVTAGRVLVLPAGASAELSIGADEHWQSPLALPDPVLRLDFEGFDGRRVTDHSPLEQRVWVTRVPPPTAGVRGTGLQCDTERTLLVADHPSLNGDRGTLCFWLKPRRPLPEHEAVVPARPVEFFSKADWGSKQGWEFLRPAHGEERWGLRLMPGDGETYDCWTATPTGTDWFHTAVSWGDGLARIYRDGEEVARSAVPAFTMADLDANARIGNNFLGSIDEVRLYDAILSPAQIRAVAAGE